MKVQNGQRFPRLTVARVGGGTIMLPDDLGGRFGVVLVNRGHWCPYCNAQLRAFQRAHEALTAHDIQVVSFSVDDEASAAEVVKRHGLSFPVGYGVDARQVADVLGAYVNDDPPYLQSTGFLLAPDTTVLVAVYSSGAIGRLVPDDVVGMVKYVRGHA